MRLNDGTGDRQPHAHAGCLRRDECVKYQAHVPAAQPRSAIRHSHPRLLRIHPFGPDDQFTPPIHDQLHGFNAVDDQIYQHLLKLNSITDDEQRTFRALQSMGHPVAAKFVRNEVHCLGQNLIDVERQHLRIGLSNQGTDSPNHFACPVCVPSRFSQGRRAPHAGPEIRDRASPGTPPRSRRPHPAAGSFHAQWRRSARPGWSRA